MTPADEQHLRAEIHAAGKAVLNEMAQMVGRLTPHLEAIDAAARAIAAVPDLVARGRLEEFHGQVVGLILGAWRAPLAARDAARRRVDEPTNPAD